LNQRPILSKSANMSATAARTIESDSPKRQQILDAAADLFIVHGYGAVSMDAIARAAAVSKATLYAHFGSKDQLFATIIREACQSNFTVKEFLTDDPDIRAALSRLGHRMLGFLLEERALAIHRVVISESLRFPELGRAFFESGPKTFIRVFGDWLATHAQAGRLHLDDPARAADQFVGLLKCGTWTRAALGVPPPPDAAEITATVSAAVETFIRAYGA
jgi:TetR/AcrR family transcriptional regulator, mexJK operon transcriptional repressor